MRLLLDTHVAIWAVMDDVRLTRPIYELISDPANEIAVSAVSVLEIAIKYPLSRSGIGDMPLSSEEALGFFRGADFMLLDVTPEHATVVERLPGVHRDPFDRLLIAQALTEPMRFVTHDAQLAAYSDSIIVF